MGLAMTKLFDRIFGKKEMRILMLGLDAAGKTTIFYIVCGLVKLSSGKVFFDDEDITAIPLHKRALKGIGYLPQESSIFKDLSVEENLLLAAEIVIKDKEEQNRRVEELLELWILNLFVKEKESLFLVVKDEELKLQELWFQNQNFYFLMNLLQELIQLL